MKYLIIFSVCIFLLWACEPCADCGKPLISEPGVSATFINLDTLSKVDTAIASNAKQKSAYASLKSSLTTRTRPLNDSIKKYTDSVTAGATEYQLLLDQYTASRKILLDSSLLLDTLTSDVTDSTTYLNKIRTWITTGKVRIDTIFLIENGNFLTYEDSLTRYYLPLLMEANETSFRIKIKEEIMNVTFTYTTSEYVDEVQRLIKIRAENIEVSSPDSIQYFEDETKLYFYF